MRLTWLGGKVIRLEIGLEHFLIAKNSENIRQLRAAQQGLSKQITFDNEVAYPFAPFENQLPSQKSVKIIDEGEQVELYLRGDNFLLIDRSGVERIIVTVDGIDESLLPAEWVADAIIIMIADERDELVKSFKAIKNKKSAYVKPRHYLLAIPPPDEELFERFVCAVGDSPAQILEAGYMVEL